MDRQIQRLLNKKIAFVGSTDEGKPFVKAMLVSWREGSNIFYFDSNNGSVRVAVEGKSRRLRLFLRQARLSGRHADRHYGDYQ